MIDKLHLTLTNRVLKATENLYSGESIVVELEDPGLVQLTALDYNLVLFGADKSILAASEPFTASDSKWTATLNTATAAFQSYYENVSASTAKTLGMMIVSRTTGDTICAGTISATSVPFPSQTSSIPGLYGDVMATMAANKMDKVASAVENNMAVFDSAGGVKDSGVAIKRNVTVDQHGYSHGSLGIGNVRGIAEHEYSVAIGDNGYTDINGDNAVAVGMNCGAGEGSVAVGEEAGAEDDSVVVGYASCGETAGNVIIGNNCGVTGESTKGVVVGNESNIDGDSEGYGGSMNSVAVGYRASINCASNAVQLGQGVNSTPGTLQFRSFPLMGANGRIAKPAICGTTYYGQGGQNVYVIDGLAFTNFYFLYARNSNQPCSYIFDYSALTGNETDRVLMYYQGPPNALNLTFRTRSDGEDFSRSILNCDVEGVEVDWTSSQHHVLLLLAVIGDCGDCPQFFCLAKYVSQH